MKKIRFSYSNMGSWWSIDTQTSDPYWHLKDCTYTSRKNVLHQPRLLALIILFIIAFDLDNSVRGCWKDKFWPPKTK